MGLSGEASLKFLIESGVPRNEIITFDDRGIGADVSDRNQMAAIKIGCIVLSPGVAIKSDFVQGLLSAGAKLLSEVQLAYDLITSEKLIAVTGSLGKSTTTSMIGQAAKTQDPNCFVGGNLGLPFIEYFRHLIKHPDKKARFIVLELSSFQIEALQNFRTDCLVYTYLSKNHLDRYTSVQEYYDSKWALTQWNKGKIFVNQKGVSIVNMDSAEGLQKFGISKLNVFGKHNLQNAALACEVAKFFGWSNQAFEAIANYKGLKHRLETVAEIGGKLFINDSKATSIESVLAAIHSLRETSRPLRVLVGGKDKGLDWTLLAPFAKTKIQFYFFGADGEFVKQKSGLNGLVYKKLSDCLSSIKPMIQKGDVILLAPGGTSLDEFKSFEDRGDFFKSWVFTFQNEP
jgi:UDP-N-acetylmuramoylalanine--D-glutamate ligase